LKQPITNFIGKAEGVIFYFSRHAKRQMLWHRISEEDVKTVIGSPDDVQETIKYRKNAIKDGAKIAQGYLYGRAGELW
jgi:hypothetical protein